MVEEQEQMQSVPSLAYFTLKSILHSSLTVLCNLPGVVGQSGDFRRLPFPGCNDYWLLTWFEQWEALVETGE